MVRRNVLFVFLFAFLLAASVGFAATSSTETTGEYIDDTAITAKVKAGIMEESTLKTLDIKVVTEKEVVTLTGAVPTKANITKAGEIAVQVKGVKSVRNELQTK